MVGRMRALSQVFYGTFIASPLQRLSQFPPVRARLLLAVLLASVCAGAGIAAQAASAFTPAQARATVDGVSREWQRTQQRDGALVDYVSRRPTYGYADVMIGYGMLRAGVRRHDRRLIASGFRAVSAGLRRAPAQRGVFDTLANSTVYEWALRNLPRDPGFVALRPRWETYLRTIAEPYIRSGAVAACTADPVCFHNHEAVNAFGELQLVSTRLRSSVPGAKLADPAALRGAAVHVLSAEIESALGDRGTSTWSGVRSRLGLLSDTGTWPLAYHDFSTAMVAGAIVNLGGGGPPVARAALERAARSLAAFMAPDGDVAYLGRRQQQAWALASAVYAATVVARLPGQDARTAGQMQAVADRAFARLTSAHRNGPAGLGAVPRPLTQRTGFHGVDANEIVPSALVIFLLNLAADQAEAAGPTRATALPADTDGSFLEPDQTGFATVRHGDLWYAVHRRPITYDLRYDFGLVALKRRDPAGRWRDVVRPRPNTRGPTHDSAGPVIVKNSVRYLPFGTSVATRPGGIVLVRGGFRSEKGVWLRRGVTFRFAPVAGGVALSFPLKAGDRARIVTFLPQSEARVRTASVSDRNSTASVSLRPTQIRLGRGYASCCDEHLVAAAMSLRPASSQTVVYTVRSRGGGGGGRQPAARVHKKRDGGFPVIGAGAAVLAALPLMLLVVTRGRRPARRPHSPR